MPLTPAQRAAVNRKNARKSTGPRTDAGKAASRQNSMKHGFRAETLPVPVENPAELQALSDAWHDFYRPASPAEAEAVDIAVRCCIQRRRGNRYYDAALAEQVRSAVGRGDAHREDDVARLAALLADDPAAAVRGLRRTTQGLEWLVARWKEVRHALIGRGGWTPEE